jgi:hypothetical protein
LTKPGGIWRPSCTCLEESTCAVCLRTARSANPVENLWKHIRQNYFGQGALDSLQEVEERLCRAFQALDQQPEVVKSLCGYWWIRAISTRPLPPEPIKPT